MSALLIDIGNTRLKLATLANGELQFVAAIDTEPLSHCQSELDQHWQRLQQAVGEVWAVSVAAQQTNDMVQARLGQKTLHWVHPEREAAGVTNAYPEPRQLGPDRWAGVIGLTRHFKASDQAIVLASFGTATTVDTLSPDRQFLGGLILPGVSMMQQALNRGTARLPNAPGSLQAFPNNTVSAIASGIAAAQAGAVMRQIEHARQRFGKDPLLCVSGGAWPMVQEEFATCLPTIQIKEVPHIVLHGLAALAEQNNSQ